MDLTRAQLLGIAVALFPIWFSAITIIVVSGSWWKYFKKREQLAPFVLFWLVVAVLLSSIGYIVIAAGLPQMPEFLWLTETIHVS